MMATRLPPVEMFKSSMVSSMMNHAWLMIKQAGIVKDFKEKSFQVKREFNVLQSGSLSI
jgi:hypothetical protein